MRSPLATGAAIDTGAPHPVVDGNRIVDARSGREFVPRGVNWSSFEYACAQGWGTSALENEVARDPYASEAAAIAELGRQYRAGAAEPGLLARHPRRAA